MGYAKKKIPFTFLISFELVSVFYNDLQQFEYITWVCLFGCLPMRYLIIDHWSVKWGSWTAAGPSANIPSSFTRKVSCIWVENVAMLTLWLLLTFISLVIFPFFTFFSLVVMSSARDALCFSTVLPVVLVVSRSVCCMSPVSGSSLELAE